MRINAHLLPLGGCENFVMSLVLHTKIIFMRLKKEISIKFGENVRKFRLQKGFSQEELAHIAEVHRTYIGIIERGEKNITLVNIEKIAVALEMSIVELLTFKNGE